MASRNPSSPPKKIKKFTKKTVSIHIFKRKCDGAIYVQSQNDVEMPVA